MADLIRYDPFALEPIERTMDDLFRGFFPTRAWGWPQMRMPQLQQLRLDVTENDKSYTIKADLPGLKKEDIQVSVDGNEVTIRAETKQEKEQKEGEKVVCSERYEGSLYRSFTLPQEVKSEGAQAKYENGVLMLTLPKAEQVHGKMLAVE